MSNRREKAVLELAETLDFGSTMDLKITTTGDLSKTINQLMRQATKDYYGCMVEPNAHGQIAVYLYFRDNGGGDMTPIHQRQRGESQRDRIERMGRRNRNKTYKFSEELEDMLKQISYPTGRNGQVNLDRNVTEVSDRAGSNMNQIYLRVEGIDINEILKIVYGNKMYISDKKDSRILYQVRVLNPIPGIPAMPGRQFLIAIDRLNEQEIIEIANRVGVTSSQASLPIMTSI